jgi:hypothetical protein
MSLNLGGGDVDTATPMGAMVFTGGSAFCQPALNASLLFGGLSETDGLMR